METLLDYMKKFSVIYELSFLVFFIAHDHKGELLTGSQHTATKTIIGRGWIKPEVEEAISKMK